MREREWEADARTRLRPAHSPEQLAKIYAKPWGTTDDTATTPDHRIRIASTIAVARWFDRVATIADLSCGDGFITMALERPDNRIIRGDFAPGYDVCGPIEETIDQIEPVDLFICSETLEHLDDPEMVLAKIRAKTRYLVATSPIGEWNPVHNPEHYWGWGTEAFKDLLVSAGFEPIVFTAIETPPPWLYDWQIAGCQ